jgi:hypothetical protein
VNPFVVEGGAGESMGLSPVQRLRLDHLHHVLTLVDELDAKCDGEKQLPAAQAAHPSQRRRCAQEHGAEENQRPHRG